VTAFGDVGIPNAAALLNFVVITAALSAFNSGMYSTGRMLLTLAQNGQAPTVFEKISARGHVPFVGILFSGVVLLIGVVLNLLLPRDVFLYLSSVATIALIFNWTMILLTQWHFRRTKMAAGQASRLRFPLFAWPYTTYLGLGGMALVVAMMAFQPTTRIALFVGPMWFATLACGYYIMRRRSSPLGGTA
jgi:AAT family amino acid transporter